MKNNLEEYFRSDKSDWMHIDENGNIKWDNCKVALFWKKIREHKILVEDFNFDNYVFPQFERFSFEYEDKNLIKDFLLDKDYNDVSPVTITSDSSFWKKGDKLIFEKTVSFVGAKFLDKSEFRKIVFAGRANFSHCTFNETTNFSNSYFTDFTDFTDCKFKEISIFDNVVFKGATTFKLTAFKKLTSFKESIFVKEVNFTNVAFKRTFFEKSRFFKNCNFSVSKFTDLVLFKACTFFGSVTFYHTHFQKRALFPKTKFLKKVNFDITSIFHKSNDEKKSIFYNINFQDSVDLSKILLPPGFEFKQMDLSKFLFNPSQNLTEISFLECKFKGNRRIILNFNRDGIENVLDLFKLYTSESFYKSKEYQYRGLKKNFENSRDWVLSGLSFRSEMEMKKRKIFIESFRKFSIVKFLEFLIFWFYGFFSGYTQSIIRPLFFIGLLVTAGAYYYSNWVDIPLNESVYRSITYSFPYLELSQSLKDTSSSSLKYFGVFQKVFGLILLTFFVLSLRKRFKQ